MRIISIVLISKNTRQRSLVTFLLVFLLWLYVCRIKSESPVQPVDAQMIQFQSEDEKLQGATQSACKTLPLSFTAGRTEAMQGLNTAAYIGPTNTKATWRHRCVSVLMFCNCEFQTEMQHIIKTFAPKCSAGNWCIAEIMALCYGGPQETRK